MILDLENAGHQLFELEMFGVGDGGDNLPEVVVPHGEEEGTGRWAIGRVLR